jgi:hypothetical protein
VGECEVTDGGELDVGGVGHEEVSVEVGGAHARGGAHAHHRVVRRGPTQCAAHVPRHSCPVGLRLRTFIYILSTYTHVYLVLSKHL